MSVESAVQAIRYMLANDCDFLTVSNVRDYGQASEDDARIALAREMGAEWMREQANYMETSVPRDSFGNYDPSDTLLDHLDDRR